MAYRFKQIRPFLSRAVALAMLSSLGACSSGYAAGSLSNPVVHEASGTPDHFMVGSATGSETTEPTATGSCRNPMVDPQDGTRLVLVRSTAGRGDYEVPAGHYGVGVDELLRIECATGRVVGIVRR